jgi:hypothetical protein
VILVKCKIKGGPKVGVQYIVYSIPTFGPLCVRKRVREKPQEMQWNKNFEIMYRNGDGK